MDGKVKEINELGDELCKYCHRDEHLRGCYSTPSGIAAGCEGVNCLDAYDNYLEESASAY
jgi:hypothetical protein